MFFRLSEKWMIYLKSVTMNRSTFETWHDADYVCVRRLRTEGFQVAPASMAINHGGFAVAAANTVKLLDLGFMLTSFEMLAVRVPIRLTSYFTVVIYRPETDAVSSAFFFRQYV